MKRHNLIWNEARHSVGIAAIDEDHRGIVERVNRLAEATMQGNCGSADALVDDLVNFARAHFALEERLMAQYGFAGLQEHKAEHDALLHQVYNLKRVCHLPQADKAAIIAAFLTDWAEQHILVADKEIAAFLIRKGLS